MNKTRSDEVSLQVAAGFFMSVLETGTDAEKEFMQRACDLLRTNQKLVRKHFDYAIGFSQMIDFNREFLKAFEEYLDNTEGAQKSGETIMEDLSKMFDASFVPPKVDSDKKLDMEGKIDD